MEENTNRVRNSLGLMISQVVKQSSLYKFHKSSQINSKVLKCLYDIMKSYNRRCMRTYLLKAGLEARGQPKNIFKCFIFRQLAFIVVYGSKTVKVSRNKKHVNVWTAIFVNFLLHEKLK